jgi:spermidine synthase
LRLLEPPESCHETLRERLYSGSYDKPFVVDNGPRRFLHFDFGAIQSVMELSNPVRLALAYTRKMMAFLLFNRTPKRILLLGLGGGSLAKFCYANLARRIAHGHRRSTRMSSHCAMSSRFPRMIIVFA